MMDVILALSVPLSGGGAVKSTEQAARIVG